MKKLSDSARQAAHQTSYLITSEIRQSAIDSGWPSEVAQNTRVMYDGSAYQVSVRADLESEAMDLEYGTPQKRPTAVLRKYANNTSSAEDAFLGALERNLGVAL